MPKLLLSASLAVNLAAVAVGALWFAHEPTPKASGSDIVSCRKALRGEANAVMVLCYQQSFITADEMNDWFARNKK